MFKVFIADGARAIRDDIEKRLLPLDDIMVVGKAKDAYEALEGIKESKPAIIILEKDLPEAGALNVLKSLQFKCIGSFVIILCQSKGDVDRKKLQNLGANYFLDKVAELGKIYELIQDRVIESKEIIRLHRQNF